MKRKPRATVKFEWKPGWQQVRERLLEPASCAPGQYRTKTLSKSKDVKGVMCCPRGTKLTAKRGCRKDGGPTGSMKLQALRHGVKKFQWNHPDVWKQLQAARPDAKGIRTVQVAKERVAAAAGWR